MSVSSAPSRFHSIDPMELLDFSKISYWSCANECIEPMIRSGPCSNWNEFIFAHFVFFTYSMCLCGCAYSAVVRRLRAVGNIFFQTSQFDWTYLGKVNKSGFWVIISSRVVVSVCLELNIFFGAM